MRHRNHHRADSALMDADEKVALAAIIGLLAFWAAVIILIVHFS